MKVIPQIFYFLILHSTFSLEAQRRFELLENGDVLKVRVTDGSYFQRDYDVKGTPYLNEQFQLGKWITKNQRTIEVPLRYDTYRDVIQLVHKGERGLLTKSENVEAEIAGRRYLYRDYLDHNNLKSGYLTPLNEGKTLLYSRTSKIIVPPRMPENGYEFVESAKFKTKIIHYIKRQGKTATPLQDLSRKEVFAVLWDKYSELRKYARQNKLFMRTEDEVIQVLEYYDSLNANIDAKK